MEKLIDFIVRITYILIHGFSYYIRNYWLTLPALNILGLDPIITEYFIINGVLGACAYKLAGIHYDGGFAPLGSALYLIEYITILILLYACLFIFRIFGLSDIVSLFVALFISLVGNLKLSSQ